jgi:hypothetical protein
MEAARTSETSVDIQLRTRQYNPEDSELHTRRRENLKFHNDHKRWLAVEVTSHCQLYKRTTFHTKDISPEDGNGDNR